MSLKVQLLDIDTRTTPFDKRLGIIQNGFDNAYSEKIERYINNSVTAKTASNIMSAFLVGKGFGDEINKKFVNKKNTLLKAANRISKSFTKQRGVYIHINYNANYQFDSWTVLPYTQCRLGKKDDDNYNGKILIYEDWSVERIKVEDLKVIDVYNPNKAVIDAQVANAGGWDKYKGQILYYNLDDDYHYALSTIDSVMNDCDSEAQASIFKNKSLRKGFFGKTLIVTEPLISGTIDTFPGTPEEYAVAVNERDEFKKTIQQFVGAENAGGVLHFELDPKNVDGDLNKGIRFENITSNIDDKLFSYTEESTFKNILMAFNNLPTGLVRSDATMFGSNGEALKEMKVTYQNNTEQERVELEQLVQMLMINFKEPMQVELIPFIDENEVIEPVTPEPNETNNKN